MPDAQGDDENTRVEAFLNRFVEDAAGAATVVMTVVGDRLGLYRAMTGKGLMTAEDLAHATGTHPRLVAEWLAAQTVSGYVHYDPETETFILPDAHAAVLSVADSPANVIGAADIIAAQYFGLDALERAFLGDGGIDYDQHDPCLFVGVERFFRPAYEHELAQTWFPAVEGLVERLTGGAVVADLGSGHGISTTVMARNWPKSRFTGYDLHAPSVETARSNAEGLGNVDFTVAAADRIEGGPFDVVTAFDSLHDMGDPPAVLRHVRELMADDGILVVVEPWSLDRLEDGIGNPAVRIDYSASTSLCTPGSLSQPGGYALGTQGGPARRLELITEAGFRDAVLAVDTGANLVLAARK